MDKSLKTTLIITFLLFSFILFLIYLLYCFAYYDKNQEEVYYIKVVDKRFDYIYTNMADKDGLDKNNYDKVLDLMFDKKNLKDIYYLYYRNVEEFELEEFINKFYYGDSVINQDDVSYSINGKTSLFKRRAIFYKSIDLKNDDGYKSSLGVKRNVSFKVEDNSSLMIDNKNVECIDNICKITKVFGGGHEISYISNGFEYYGLINITKDNQKIDITTVDELVRIDLVNDNDIHVSNDDVDYELKTGKYSLNKCYLSFGCPSFKSSYILLNDDGSCQLYTYITLDQAGDLYNGTYKKDGNFLVMNFSGHTYQVFDYDTKQSTDINAVVDIELRYRIEDNNYLSNDSYRFKFSE
jgi:hypothetical protein